MLAGMKVPSQSAKISVPASQVGAAFTCRQEASLAQPCVFLKRFRVAVAPQIIEPVNYVPVVSRPSGFPARRSHLNRPQPEGSQGGARPKGSRGWTWPVPLSAPRGRAMINGST